VSTHLFDPPASNSDFSEQNALFEALAARSQAGDEEAVEEMLARFRPLLRARMHWLWQSVREEFCALEWADIEAQVHEMFLSRLQKFRAQDGVFFPHYAAKMLDFDARDWLRRQKRSPAVPFSQLHSAYESSDDLEFWLDGALCDEDAEKTSGVDDLVSLQNA